MDADDEFLPNRVEKMEEVLRTDDLDILFDSAVLFDGSTDQKIRDLIIPQNLFQEDGELFLFQRNFLPGPNWHFFKTEKALEVGYDNGSMIAEDHDFNLRAVVKGLAFGFSKKITYKQKSFPNSFSRDIHKQLQRTKNAVLKHDPDLVLSLLKKSAIDIESQKEIMINFFLYRSEFKSAMNLLEDFDLSQKQVNWKMNSTKERQHSCLGCRQGKNQPY